VTVNNKEDNSEDFCLDFVQKFGLRSNNLFWNQFPWIQVETTANLSPDPLQPVSFLIDREIYINITAWQRVQYWKIYFGWYSEELNTENAPRYRRRLWQKFVVRKVHQKYLFSALCVFVWAEESWARECVYGRGSVIVCVCVTVEFVTHHLKWVEQRRPAVYSSTILFGAAFWQKKVGKNACRETTKLVCRKKRLVAW
jgi:hypothetical protein